MRNSIVGFIFLAIACVPGQRDVKFQQYYAEGEVLYQQHCANCHQADGSGLGKLYPPLAKSDFLEKGPEAVLCLIKYGVEGEMIVNGITYNKAMPGIPSLTELEIAEIVTYILNSWGNTSEMVEVNQASLILDTCSETP
ncbi:MAG: cytochrome c [Cyclobacteriaceae bacterium]|nr:cytochrome c [Cyclobacteriaceae bacterium]